MDAVVISTLGIKTEAIGITNQLQEIQLCLFEMLKEIWHHTQKKCLSFEKHSNITWKVSQYGYILSTCKAQETLQAMRSFVAHKNGKLVVLFHVPIYKTQSTLFAYRYVSTPFTTTNNETTLIIGTGKKILAFNIESEM